MFVEIFAMEKPELLTAQQGENTADKLKSFGKITRIYGFG